MDEMVRAAMAKWPNVPDCEGWLALCERGHWWLRDDAAQAAGPFAGPGSHAASKGSRLEHPGLVAFLGRNYSADAQGRWFVQNGPQRVYVTLANTPWVYRLHVQGTQTQWSTHTGVVVQPSRAWCDETGRVYVASALGPGLLHSQDMDAFVSHGGALLAKAMAVEVTTQALPQTCGFARM